jgi:hypothetical protein
MRWCCNARGLSYEQSPSVTACSLPATVWIASCPVAPRTNQAARERTDTGERSTMSERVRSEAALQDAKESTGEVNRTKTNLLMMAAQNLRTS